MKALKIDKPFSINLENREIPIARDGKVLVKVKNVSICRSDIKIYQGDMDGIVYPVIPGHEWSGEVVAAPGADRELAGKRVVGDILHPCYGCYYCRKGLFTLCRNLKETGLTLPGAYAEFVLVDGKNLFILPDQISSKDACIIEPLAVVLQAFKKLAFSPFCRVAVYGAGALGLLIIQVARLYGAGAIAAIDLIPERLERAGRLGAEITCLFGETGAREKIKDFCPDTIFFAADTSAPFPEILDVIKPHGKIAVIGYTHNENVNIRLAEIMAKSLQIHGVLSPTEWDEAILLMERKLISTQEILTHGFPLEEYEKAFEYMTVKKNQAVKVFFTCSV